MRKGSAPKKGSFTFSYILPDRCLPASQSSQIFFLKVMRSACRAATRAPERGDDVFDARRQEVDLEVVAGNLYSSKKVVNTMQWESMRSDDPPFTKRSSRPGLSILLSNSLIRYPTSSTAGVRLTMTGELPDVDRVKSALGSSTSVRQGSDAQICFARNGAWLRAFGSDHLVYLYFLNNTKCT